MKIMFCIGSLLNGGAERVVSNLANELIKKNEIKIVSLTKTEIAYKLDERIDVSFLDTNVYKSELNGNKKITKNLKRLFALKKNIKEYRPDIIVAFLPEPSFLVLLLKKFNGIPTIISVRNDPKIEYKSKVYNFLMKKLYPITDGVVFQTTEAKEYFSDILKCSQTVIPNPINESFIMEEFKGERRKEIVTVGRLQEQKNQKMLINAFSKLDTKFKEYKLIIYGEGQLRKELEELIEKLKLKERVVLYGVCKDIKEKIYDVELFVLTSDYEGMPNALMEAMTMGLPVISTDCPCGGPKFLINNNENGILIDVNDEAALKKSIEEVLENKEFSLKLQKNARNIAIELNPSKINRIWAEYIEKIYKEFK